MKQGDYQALMEVLDQYGPVSVSIDSSHPKFVSYSTGYFKSGSSNATNIGSKILIKYKLVISYPVLYFLRSFSIIS